MIKKILLLNPSNTVSSSSVRRIAQPLGVLYLASVLQKNNYKVEIIDSSCEGYYNILEEGEYLTYGLSDDKIKDKVKKSKADLIGISSMFSSTQERALHHCDIIKQVTDVPIVIGGIHPSLEPKETVSYPSVDYVIEGEGEYRLLNLINTLNSGGESFDFDGVAWKENGVVRYNPMTTRIQDLDSIPFPAYELIDFEKYVEIGVPFAPFPKAERTCQIMTSRGCPFRCLEGNTLVNTINGKIKIKDLVGLSSIKVLSRNPKTLEVEFTKAINIRKTRTKASLVRVHFDDDTYIDCTPDHKFLMFKNGNQFVKTREYEVQAKDLKPKQSVRAIRYQFNSHNNDIMVCWDNHREKYEHRLVMEGILNKKLDRFEFVHHKDRNRQNNRPDNLKVVTPKEHSNSAHPEIAERMKNDNPCKYCTEESYQLISKKNKGKKRTKEHKENIRKSKLGHKNPMYGKHPIPWNKGKIGIFSEEEIQKRREKWLGSKNPRYNPKLHKEQINHKVVKVEPLPYKKDVYCMEVPGYNWFYANNVLVHNCVFCSTVNYWGRQFRARSVENIMEEIHYVVDKYKVNEIQFADDNMTIDRKRAMELFQRYKDEIRLPWCTPHGLMIKTLDEEMIKLMAESGAYQVSIAVESGNERVLKEIIHKPVPPKAEVKRIVDLFHKYGVQVHGLFVMGFPGEKREEIMDTLNYPFDVGFESVAFFNANPMPGSDLHKICVEKGYLKEHSRKDFKSSEIVIPKDSSDYFMEPKELTDLIDKYTKKYNDWSRKMFPKQWEQKFKLFLEKHPEQREKVLGRVT